TGCSAEKISCVIDLRSEGEIRHFDNRLINRVHGCVQYLLPTPLTAIKKTYYVTHIIERSAACINKHSIKGYGIVRTYLDNNTVTLTRYRNITLKDVFTKLNDVVARDIVNSILSIATVESIGIISTITY